MRLRWSETGCLLVVCGLALLPACRGPSDSGSDWWDTINSLTIPCAEEPDQWLILVGTFGPSVELQVGSSVECYLTSGYPSCRDHIASVEWETTVPGVVSLAPGPEVYEAILTAEEPGTTRIRAEVTYLSGRVVPARRSGSDPDIVVVPAPGASRFSAIVTGEVPEETGIWGKVTLDDGSVKPSREHAVRVVPATTGG